MTSADESELLAVFTTVSNDEQASALADLAIATRLAACVQAEPIRSTYRWQGGVVHETEVRLMLKTTRSRYAALEKLLREWEPDDPVVRIGRQLPPATLHDTDPARMVEELVQLARLPPDGVFVATRWQPDRSTVSVAVGTRESVAPGVFHRVTGALTSQRMEILAADIHTLEDGLVIDHFTLVDPDFAGAPPADRLADVAAAIGATKLAAMLAGDSSLW